MPTPMEFAIPTPSGSYTDATWSIVATSSFPTVRHRLSLETGGANIVYTATWQGSYSDDVTASTDQLDDIIAAAGSTLDLIVEIVSSDEIPPPAIPDDIEDDVTVLLILTDSGGGGGSPGVDDWNKRAPVAYTTVIAISCRITAGREITAVSAKARSKVIVPATSGTGGAGRTVVAPVARCNSNSVYMLGDGGDGDNGGDNEDPAGTPGGSTASTGNVLIGQVRDLAGSTIATEAAIAAGDENRAFGWNIGAYYGCMYTREGAVLVETTPDPNSWGGSETDTGLSGALLSVASNSSGVLLGLLGQSVIVSRDNGGTWAVAGTAPKGALSLLAEGDLFVAICFDGAEPIHRVSYDAGGTWV